MMKAYGTFDEFLRDQTPGNRAIIRALRKFVKATHPQLSEAVRWGNGCWLAGAEPIAFAYPDAGLVQFGFFTGALLKDPRGLLEGKARYVRHIKVRAPSEIDHEAFGDLLAQAAARRRPARHRAPASTRPR